MQDRFDEIREEWAKDVGRAMLAFGDIEAFTYLFLEFFLFEDEAIASLAFGRRVTAIKAFITPHQNVKGVSALLKELDHSVHLAKIRNTFAHNPFEINVDSARKENETFLPRIRNPKTGHFLTLKQVQKFRNQAETSAAKLNELLFEIGIVELYKMSAALDKHKEDGGSQIGLP